MGLERDSGILLHPTSLPGPDGIGDLGPEAYRWIDFLSVSGCTLWQILPLGPTGYGDSPYQSFSAFAGNPYLISPVMLLEKKLLRLQDLVDRPVFPRDAVDFGPVIVWKLMLLNKAFEKFYKTETSDLRDAYDLFCLTESDWLKDYALFMAIKETHKNVSWNLWPEGLRNRNSEAISEFLTNNMKIIEKQKFWQFLFFDQWNGIRNYARSKKIKIIGDIPIFVSYDSADTWSHPELFFLDSKGRPTHVAGVPPDYFSPTGQLWGNPLYRWKIHKKENYEWWIKRFTAVFKIVDIVRLDHFRGFAGYWEVPANMPTAEIGRWVKGPGKNFLIAIEKAFPALPIIAEDLGLITPEVIILRDNFKLPGMKIMQFAFASTPEDSFLPHNYPVNCVAYSGTHDNDTTKGWFESAPEKERDFCRRYLASSNENVSLNMIRALWASVAAYTIVPLQDLLDLGTESRMNYPGTSNGNWRWRCKPEDLSKELSDRLKELNYLFNR